MGATSGLACFLFTDGWGENQKLSLRFRYKHRVSQFLIEQRLSTTGEQRFGA